MWPMPAFFHLRHTASQEEERAAQVDLPDQIEMPRLNRFDRARNEDGGVVHEDVDRAPLRDHLRHACVDALGVAHIHAHGERLAAAALNTLSDGVDRSGEALVRYFLRPCGDGDLRPGPSEVLRDVLTDAPARARDDRHPSVQ